VLGKGVLSREQIRAVHTEVPDHCHEQLDQESRIDDRRAAIEELPELELVQFELACKRSRVSRSVLTLEKLAQSLPDDRDS
jgi:nicotinic acid mononucleotide adenylyltransferase